MLRVRDIMTEDLITVRPNDTIREAAELFAEHHIGGAPVVRDGRVVGIITANDILEFTAALESEPEVTDRVATNLLEEHTVDEAMTRAPLRTLGPEATVDEAARLMQDAGVHRVVVMEGATPLGVVSTLDLVGAIADGRMVRRTFVFPRRT